MGLMGQAAVGKKMMEFLSPNNLRYLTVLLDVVTEENSPSWKAVWSRFADADWKNPDAAMIAQGRLKKLNDLLKEYIKQGK